MLKSLFQTPVVGLDIHKKSISLIVLKKIGSTFELEKADREDFIENTDKLSDNSEFFTKHISDLIKRSKIKNKNISTCVPDSESITKIISLPSDLTEEEIQNQINYEGNNYIPSSLDSVNFDFFVLRPDESRKNYNKVLVIACKKEIIQDWAATIEEAKLKIKNIEIESLSLLRLYQFLYEKPKASSKISKKKQENNTVEKNNNVVIVHVSFDFIKIIAFENDCPIYVREHKFGFSNLIENISQTYGITFTEAFRMQKHQGLPPDYESKVKKPFVQTLAKEINHGIDFFQSSMSEVPIHDICVFGIHASFVEVEQYIHSTNKCTINVPNIFEKIKISRNIPSTFLEKEGHNLSIALSLALRGLI